MSTMTIKRGLIELKCPRSELVEVVETADGVSFSLKGNLQLYFSDQFMQSSTKQLIKQAADNFPNNKLIINLDNPRTPAMIDAT